ncbi:MAG: DUF1549 domain-containing protein [Planctomycetota bacterium]|nr:MAG: DUF1549 domain-containing protein [Planctomycetota bacterium]
MAFIDLKYRGLSCRLILFTTLILAFEFQGTVEGAPQEIDRAAASPSAVYFGTEVVPILTKLGCNGGGCHGKATGQNGFRLSLFGFEPEFDYEAIVKESRGRRLSLAAPDQSLLLAKATATMPHGGGRRLAVDSHDYQILRQWISQGAPAPSEDDPHLVRVEITPHQQIMHSESSLQLHVTGAFSDGTSRDVTLQAIYQSNEVGIATVTNSGLVQTSLQHGLFSVMARFGEQLATFHAAVPFASEPTQLAAINAELDKIKAQLLRDAESPREWNNNSVDSHLFNQWRQLGIVPSAVADDATFLRRVTLDIIGTLPSDSEVTEYLTAPRSDKRQALINRLLERPEYASYFALKWADVLQNRGAGYSTSKQRAGTTLFAEWIRDSLEANKPYDQFVSEILTATGSQNENPPAIWYRTVRKPAEYVESVAQAFLGVRVQCAQCHHHPTERWSQSDYYGLAAVFSRVGRKGGFADAEVPTDEMIFLKESAVVLHPRTGKILKPQPLGGNEFSLGLHDDPRVSLARWMSAGDNPFFARTMVNRMWAHFMGRGIVHPIDDARSTNPPSNPELLDGLAQDFISSGYDLKQLIRVIANSYAYRLESAPHAGNVGDTQTFARFYPRRMPAEVLLDGISQVLDVPTNFDSVPPGTRAIELPDENVAANFLDVFGRPLRMSACECERVDAPALTQALELVNSSEIQRKLTEKTGYAEQLAISDKSPEILAREIFLRVFARHPRPEELNAATLFFAAEPDRGEACRSLLWSLLATNEFMFNH